MHLYLHPLFFPSSIHSVTNRVISFCNSIGNSLALDLWKTSYRDLTMMPSRYTAEEMERSAREEFLQEVNTKGVVKDYTG